MARIKMMLMALVVLGGCAAQTPQVPTVVTKYVNVPVPFTPPASEALLKCGHATPAFRFYAVPGGSPDDVMVKAGDQPKLRAWVDEKDRCIDAWRAGYGS